MLTRWLLAQDPQDLLTGMIVLAVGIKVVLACWDGPLRGRG